MDSKRRRYLLIAGTGLVAVIIVWRMQHRHERRDLQARFQYSLQQSETDKSVELAERLLRDHHSNHVVMSVAKALENDGQFRLAIDWYSRLAPNFLDDEIRAAWIRKARLQLRLGDALHAQQSLLDVVDEVQSDQRALSELAEMWAGFGLPLRSVAYLRQAEDIASHRLEDLELLARNGKRLFTRVKLERLHGLNSADPLVLSGLLELAWRSRDLADVERILTPKREPKIEWAHHLQRAKERLPDAEIESWSGFLFSIGRPIPQNRLDVALSLSEFESPGRNSAARLRKLLNHVPWCVEANAGLANWCRRELPDRAAPLSELVAKLRQIESLAPSAVREIQRNAAGGATAELVELLCGLHRFDEARGWARFASSSRPDLLQLVQRYVDEGSEYSHPGFFDLKHSHAQTRPESSKTKTPVILKDRAAELALEFRYRNGAAPNQNGLKMHQWTGGGIAVLDYDSDGWPDCYFTQGGQLAIPQSDAVDQLFRNVRGHSFRRATDGARVSERGFGQGVAAGDVNNDGFVDLYVANVGVNRLLLNQGDGTFLASDQGASTWTTSVAIADVTGDANPDLYDVNYLRGAGVYTQTCDHDGEQRVCSPTDFEANPDALHVGSGRGKFRSVRVQETERTGTGMGVLVGDILNDGVTRVYVANDEFPNYLLQFGEDGRILNESATLAGVAVSGSGQPQGSMGIASGDFDGNGQPDLFVTNYYSEANNLYRMVNNGMFVDESASPSLTQSGFAMLGFGCQFFDADADGHSDLLIANGHLDDFTHQGKPFRMPTLFYRNSSEQLASEAGPGLADLQIPRLGRAVATIDWNCDGATDLLLGDLDLPIVLLENQTTQDRRSAEFRLVGVTACRHPVGARIGMAGVPFPQRWVLAGDGYQCSNERVQRLVVASDEPIRHVTVDWGSRQPDTIAAPFDLNEASGRYVIVESRNSVYRIPR